MPLLPRVALGTLFSGSGIAPAVWALVDVLKRRGWQIQIFHDRACLFSNEDARIICGRNPRYLDSWLMSPDLCRESFAYEMSGSDFAVVLGDFAPARPESALVGGTLEDLCNWLDLPAIALLDVTQLGQCRLPQRLSGLAGVLLDRVPREQAAYWQTLIESMWGVPVLGYLPEIPELQDALADGVTAPACSALCSHLGNELAKNLQLNRLMKLAAQQDFIAPTPKVFAASGELAGMRIAVAFDEAIHRYFPATLDLLELHGAEVCDFSPLHDEALPPDCDLVYFGCGRPQDYAVQLAKNHCMTLALQNHLHLGRKIFAECGGMAYLCQNVVLSDGQSISMSGVLPAVANERLVSARPSPVELTLAHSQWLGRSGTILRGYLNTGWQIEPIGPLQNCVAESEYRFLIAAHRQAIGSRLHIDFAAQPQLLQRLSSAPARAIIT